MPNENYAIVIGADKYWSPDASLQGAVRDALAMREWLLAREGGDVAPYNLMLMLSPSAEGAAVPAELNALPATQDNIIQAIDLLLNRSGGEGDNFYFYFAGHGLTSLMNFASQNGIAPADFTDLLTTKALTCSSIFESFKGTRFQHQFFFVDACRNIPFVEPFRIGDYPKPLKPSIPVPPQFIMYATSLGVPAAEIGELSGKERGAFTGALLEGLKGKGAAKVWIDDAQEYQVTWDSLFKYVDERVKRRKIEIFDEDLGELAPDARTKRIEALKKKLQVLIQEPREYGEHSSENPILARFSEGDFPTETLKVDVNPDSVAAQAKIIVRDLSGDIAHKEPPLAPLPVTLSLPPRTYSVVASAPQYQPEKKYWRVDLSDSSKQQVSLVPAAPGTLSALPDTSKAPVMRGGKKKKGQLQVSSTDPLATLEVTNLAGNMQGSSQGELNLSNVKPGFYQARMRSPEGKILVEQPLELLPGETETISLNVPPLPAGGMVKEIAQEAGFGFLPDNTISLSEAVGPVTAPHLSTILALAGGAVNESDKTYGNALRRVGLKSFHALVGDQASNGLQILFGIEFGTSDQTAAMLSGIKLRLWGIDAPQPQPEQPQTLTTKGLAEFAWAKQPGPHWLSIGIGEQDPVVFAVSILPNRLNLVVFSQNLTGQINIYQYLPSLIAEPPGDPRFIGARFPVLRRLELIERAYMSERLEQATQNANELLHAKFIEPMAGCLGAYILLRQGRAADLGEAVENLTTHYPDLADSHVLRAAYLESRGETESAIKSYQTTLDYGLPMFRDGLEWLAGAVEQYDLVHPRVALAKHVFANREKGLLWSAFSQSRVRPGAPLRFDNA